MNSVELRAVLVDLESTVETSGTALQAAEAAHKVAVTRAVLHGRHSEADKSEAAVNIARTRHHAATERCEEARRLLAQAVRTEREARETAARVGIGARLDELDTLAATVDENFAALVTNVRRMRELETAIHVDVRREFGRSPWHAPLSFRALRPMATALTTEANGVSIDIKSHAATVTTSARKNIEEASRE